MLQEKPRIGAFSFARGVKKLDAITHAEVQHAACAGGSIHTASEDCRSIEAAR
jgi:hypothetical protein